MHSYTFTLRTQPLLCPLACDDCTATVELTGNHSLHELADVLLEAIGFDFDHAFGFHENLDSPYGGGVSFTMFADMGEGEDEDRSVAMALVGDVFTAGKQMLFHFDYGADWHFLVTCTHVEPAKAMRKTSRVVSVVGTPPQQYPDSEG